MVRLLAAVLSILFLATAGIAAPPAPGDTPESRARDVVAVLHRERAPDTVFTARFLDAVPPAQLFALLQRLEGQNGKLVGAHDVAAETATTAHFRLRFERAEADASLTIETAAPYKVTGFRITSVTPIGDNPRKIEADFAALPGRSGFAVYRLGDGTPQPVLASHADEQFAIGSTFKLWVLDALASEVEAGRRRWDEVVPLGPPSLPSGITQNWPKAAPLTVQTLATLMISMSDNTASDTLIRLVGRERLAESVRASGHSDPSRLLPFLTTAEAFALKLSPPAEREAYAKADDAGQLRMLDRLDPQAILATADIARLGETPVAIDQIEWFASPADVARVLDTLRRHRDPQALAIMAVAPALPKDTRARFAYVGYKGGSEAGVISLDWLLQTREGQWYAVAASWNDAEKPIDEKRFELLAQRLVGLVK